MPRGPERQWRAQKQPLTDHLIQSSVTGGLVDPQRGFYAERIYQGIENEERAVEIRRSLFRCAKRLGYSMSAHVERMPNSEFQIRFRAIDKRAARAFMVRTYGPDRTKWPYNPRMRNPGSRP